MHEEVPKNDTEKEILQILAGGGTISDCRQLWEINGYTEESFDVFLSRVSDWEARHMCGPDSHENSSYCL